ncbi:MAG: 50S ribosomal protein L20 [Gemmatimonadetes bacterium]|nr:MAG: 50S ribosomal protein L20 [Gemmatimonadota bacterium]
MPRVKSNVARLKRKNKVMKLAKGYWGGRSKLWKAAKEATERAAKYAYRDRRSKKVEFRRLWITRINAAARLHALSYNRLMNGLRKAGVEINGASQRDPARGRTPSPGAQNRAPGPQGWCSHRYSQSSPHAGPRHTQGSRRSRECLEAGARTRHRSARE